MEKGIKDNYMNILTVTRTFLFALLGFSCLLSVKADAAPQLVAGDALNLRLSKINTNDLTVTPETPGYAHNWWAGRFAGLTPGTPTTIRVAMKGNDTIGNQANVNKWNGLRPMYTYADPARYEAYVGYVRRADGNWYSTDPFLEGTGNGDVPRQNAMHPLLAPAFLSSNGAEWFPWAEIEDARPSGGNTFVFTHTYLIPSATVAMRVPFTHTYFAQFIQRLKAAQWGGVYVDEVGKSEAGLPMWCVRVEDPIDEKPADNRKTAAIFAREHATEHATSWSALGLLLRVIDRSPEMDDLRHNVRFLVVPLQDPDGAVTSRFQGQTDRWDDPKHNARLNEVLAYSRYFTNIADKGETIDLAVSLHNVEANEASNFMSPFAQSYFNSATINFNTPLFATLKGAGYTVAGPIPHGRGVMSTRLYGWLALHLGAMDLAYEVNDRDPKNRLTVAQLGHMGGLLGERVGTWLASDRGIKRHDEAKEWLVKRVASKSAYIAEEGEADSNEVRQFRLLMKGF
jgi:hypothetical protein